MLRVKILSSIEGLYLYFRRWKRYDSYQTRKKLFVILIILTFLFIWRSPSLFRFAKQKTSFFLSANKRCVEQNINELLYGKSSLDYAIDRGYEYDFNNDKKRLPYTGNGRIGLGISTTENQPFYIKNSRSLDLKLPFYPLIYVDTLNSDLQQAATIEFENGIVHRLTCMTLNNKQSINIKEKFYAHRLISSLLVQEFKINNPTNQPLVLHLRRDGWKGDDNLNSEQIFINSMIKYEYTFHSGLFKKTDDYLAFTIAAPIIPDFVEVRAKSVVNLVFYTFLNYTSPSKDKNSLKSNLTKLKLDVKNTATKVHSPLIKKAIYTNHRNAWHDLWRSGIGLSLSKAENVLNGDVINATIYYILSQKTYFSKDLDVFDPSTLTALIKDNKLIEQRASCFDGHSTFQANSLWSKLETIDDINNVVKLWLMTLDKQGCHNLIASGAEGTMQALILSMVPLEFTKNHIEFNTHPKDLHRDYYIRRLRFNTNIYLNLTVKVSEQDNRASIYVAIDRKDDKNTELLACDAGCLDEPIKLNTLYSIFPVKLTEPLTPILYITSDNQHIKELKHTIHVKEINMYSHEDHVLAMHKHGHQLSSLAAIFWLIVILLIILFHFYLIRIVINEYCSSNNNNYSSYDKVKSFIE